MSDTVKFQENSQTLVGVDDNLGFIMFRKGIQSATSCNSQNGKAVLGIW
jgi:hypothetical protein